VAQEQRGAGWRRSDAGDRFCGGAARGSPELDVPVAPVVQPSRLQAREHHHGLGDRPRATAGPRGARALRSTARGGSGQRSLPACALPVPRVAYNPRQLTQKGWREDVLLTRGLWWPELPCRVPINDGRAEEGWWRSRTGCSSGARGPLVTRIGLRSPCGGNQGVKAARDRPAMRKLRRWHSSLAVAPS
jgi:hypothetical protein